jgi:fatty acid desaturase
MHHRVVRDIDQDAFARELDAIHREITSSLGASDRRYIKRVIAVQLGIAIAGRVLILGSLPVLALASFAWFFAVIALGTLALALSKILENMEIGHNVMHGQWDWMRDPRVNSRVWEWDTICPADQWKHMHNVVHHAWANVLERDRDLGYKILRVNRVQAWHWAYLFQPLYSIVLATLFEYGVALHDIDFDALRRGDCTVDEMRAQFAQVKRKAGKQILKDYILWPALAAPFVVLWPSLALWCFLAVLVANIAANVIRNLWGWAIIFCGHFSAGVHVFTEAQVAGETRGGWYARQIMGSCNIRGGRLFRVLSGHLGHQIEHHLFPDMPSNRYPEIAPRVQALCARYGVPYNSGSLVRQLGTTIYAIVRFAFPARPTPLPT